MTLDSGFLKDIKCPDHSVLEGPSAEACDRTVDRLREMGFKQSEEWLVRKVAFAYFHDWQEDTPKYAFVLPDPGNLGNRYTEEIRSLRTTGPDVTPHKQVSFYRRLAKDWFTETNDDFSQKFFLTLSTNEVIEYPENWRTYIQSGDVFDDFYMTDVLKYRVGGYDSGGARVSCL